MNKKSSINFSLQCGRNISILLIVGISLHGCGVNYSRPNTGTETPTIEDINMVDREVIDSRTGAESAFDQLMRDADLALTSRQYGRAAAIAERAMRIAPNDPRAYFSLSRTNYYQKNIARSRSLMAKAEWLAQDDQKMLSMIEKFSASYLQ